MGIGQRTLEKVVINRSFWRDKKVFLTGHTGFKGSWLALWLQSLGAHVTGYALAPPVGPSLFNLSGADKGMTSLVADILDMESLRRTTEQAQPQIVMHLAAQSLVRASYSDPIGTYATNVMGTIHVLEAVRNCPSVKAALVVTSDKCYENREWMRGYQEQDPLGGYDPYSSSKGCAELAAAAYRRSFLQNRITGGPVALATARAGNVIGGGDWAQDRLVPDALAAFSVGKPVILRNPDAVRPWQHVLEPLAGYLLLAEKLCNEGDKFCGAWNFGPAEEDVRPVSWVVDRLADAWGGGVSWQKDSGKHPHEAGLLQLDSSKARTVMGWLPRLDLKTALSWVVDWHRAYEKGEEVRKTTLNQIVRYESIA